MTPRVFTVAAATAVIIVAGWMLLGGVSAITPSGTAVACGSALSPSHTAAQKASDDANNVNSLETLAGRTDQIRPNVYAGFEQACSAAIGTRQGWGWGLAGLGVLAGLGAVVIRRRETA